jgi:hypothetical protein
MSDQANSARHSDDGAHLPSASGGAQFNAIDPADPKDQALVRQAVKRWPKRWRGLDDAKKDKFVAGLEEAHDTAREIMRGAVDPKDQLDAAGLVLSAVKTAAIIEGQNQADEHLEEKNARLDAGQATERVDTPIKFIKGIDGDAL